MGSNLTFTVDERAKAARLLSLLVRWANTADVDSAERRALNDADDFLKEPEQSQLDALANAGKKWAVTWQGKDRGKPEILVQASYAVLKDLCSLPSGGARLTEKDIQTILNAYFRSQKARDTDQKTFLGILEDHRRLDRYGRTRESPHFTLKVWSRKVAENIREMECLWETRYQEWVKQGLLSDARRRNSPVGEKSEPKTVFADDIADRSQTIDVTPKPLTTDSQLMRATLMPYPANPVLERPEMRNLRQCLTQTFTAARFELLIQDIGENLEVLSSRYKDHEERVFDAVRTLNGQGKIIALVRGAVASAPDSPCLQYWQAWLTNWE